MIYICVRIYIQYLCFKCTTTFAPLPLLPSFSSASSSSSSSSSSPPSLLSYSSIRARYQFSISINKESRMHRPYELTGGHVPAHRARDLKSTKATEEEDKLNTF
uniref:Uncharacterized protein n=1 Tax=Glossina austeni TaxID=7395 RepID=A0A1A9UNX6_GLOAU